MKHLFLETRLHIIHDIKYCPISPSQTHWFPEHIINGLKIYALFFWWENGYGPPMYIGPIWMNEYNFRGWSNYIFSFLWNVTIDYAKIRPHYTSLFLWDRFRNHKLAWAKFWILDFKLGRNLLKQYIFALFCVYLYDVHVRIFFK